VRSKKTYLELELVREMSEHEEDEEKGRKVSHNSYARAVHYCRITGKLKLEDATCSYKREQKELVVTLPKDIKAKKTIAVTVD
jgi:ABC-type bacteriocin/lantibiotic exporter with double-glycine peptidase domain